MKKFITFALACALSFSLAACGNKNDTPVVPDTIAEEITAQEDGVPSSETVDVPDETEAAAEVPDETEATGEIIEAATEDELAIPEGQAMASLIQWMMNGTFSFDYAMTGETPEGDMESVGSMAMDGDKMFFRQEMTIEGQVMKSRLIQKDGTLYMIDDESQFIMTSPVQGEEMTDIIGNYSNITLVASGTAEVGGKTLAYEDYKEGESDETFRFYLENGEVYALEMGSDDETILMLITNASNDVPAETFDIPEGYTEM